MSIFVISYFAIFSGGSQSTNATSVCNGTRGAVYSFISSCDSPGDRFIPALVIAQMVHGIGFSPMFTLGLVYIEENEEKALAAVYIGMKKYLYVCVKIGKKIWYLSHSLYNELKNISYLHMFNPLEMNNEVFYCPKEIKK